MGHCTASHRLRPFTHHCAGCLAVFVGRAPRGILIGLCQGPRSRLSTHAPRRLAPPRVCWAAFAIPCFFLTRVVWCALFSLASTSHVSLDPARRSRSPLALTSPSSSSRNNAVGRWLRFSCVLWCGVGHRLRPRCSSVFRKEVRTASGFPCRRSPPES